MKPLGGKYCPTPTTAGCVDAKRCSICQMCVSYNPRRAKCKACYTWPVHCLCAEREMDKVAHTISQRLDRPMFDPNNPSGKVEHHRDPLDAMNHLLGGARVEVE